MREAPNDGLRPPTFVQKLANFLQNFLLQMSTSPSSPNVHFWFHIIHILFLFTLQMWSKQRFVAICRHLSNPGSLKIPHRCMMVFFHPHILVAKLENTPLCCGIFLTSHTYGDFQTAEVVQMATNGDKTLFGPHLEGK